MMVGIVANRKSCLCAGRNHHPSISGIIKSSKTRPMVGSVRRISSPSPPPLGDRHVKTGEVERALECDPHCAVIVHDEHAVAGPRELMRPLVP